MIGNRSLVLIAPAPWKYLPLVVSSLDPMFKNWDLNTIRFYVDALVTRNPVRTWLDATVKVPAYASYETLNDVIKHIKQGLIEVDVFVHWGKPNMQIGSLVALIEKSAAIQQIELPEETKKIDLTPPTSALITPTSDFEQKKDRASSNATSTVADNPKNWVDWRRALEQDIAEDKNKYSQFLNDALIKNNPQIDPRLLQSMQYALNGAIPGDPLSTSVERDIKRWITNENGN